MPLRSQQQRDRWHAWLFWRNDSQLLEPCFSEGRRGSAKEVLLELLALADGVPRPFENSLPAGNEALFQERCP